MGQRSNPVGEPWVREHLIASRSEFRMMYTNVGLGDGAEFGEYVYRELSRGVDPLIAGEAVSLHRYELPDGHPMGPPHGGHPCDNLVLGADDVLRLDS